MNARIFSLILVCSIAFFAGCSKNLQEPPDSDIWQIVSNSSDLSLFKHALDKENLGYDLKVTPNITLLAPTNDAFTAAGINQNYIDTMAAARLHNLIYYHILGNTVGASRFPTSDTVLTLQGTHIYISSNIAGKFINGITIKQGDIAATNGLVHKLNAVLRPPVDTLGKIIKTDTTLSYFNAALQRTKIVLLNNVGKYTLFAPTNAAFRKAGYSTAQDVTNSDSTELAGIVNNHIVATNYCKSDLLNLLQLTPLNSTVGILVATPPLTVKLTQRTAPIANVITTDSLAINGVMHKIDNLLLTK